MIPSVQDSPPPGPVMLAETLWHRLRMLRNRLRGGEDAQAKAAESHAVVELFRRAWNETDGGRECPARPW